MKKYYNVDRHILECDCTNPDHTLIFEYDNDDAREYISPPKEVQEPYRVLSVYVTYNNALGFFDRIRNAFNYIFKRDFVMVSDDFIFTVRNVEELQKWLDEIKQYPLHVEEKNKFDWAKETI
jgi:hypothetical protein